VKTRIVFFDRVALELSVVRTRDGGAQIRGTYTKFLGRPNDPHVTVIFEARNGLLTPHFSAKPPGRRPKRHYFEPISEERLIGTMTELGDGMTRSFADALRAVELSALEPEGWRVRVADPKPVTRWLRSAARRPPFGEYRVDESTIGAFVLHVLRTSAPPTALKELPADRPARLLLARFVNEQLEVQSLFHFPNGCGAQLPGGEIIQARPPGWYALDGNFADEEDLARIFPPDHVRQIGEEFMACLSRHPRVEGSDGDVSALPTGFSKILGFYATDLLTLMVGLRLETIELRQRGKAPRVLPPHDDARADSSPAATVRE
jgi:hypothetical protein